MWQRAPSAYCTVSLLGQGLHVNQTMSLSVSIVKCELTLLQFDQIYMTHPYLSQITQVSRSGLNNNTNMVDA